MKNIYKILGWIAFFIIVAFSSVIGEFIGKFSTKQFREGMRNSQLDSILMQTADQINQNLPIMIDAETRLDSTVGMNRIMQYNYTMVNYSAEEFDVQEFIDTVQPLLINRVCTSEEMQVFVENNVPVRYSYHGKNGKQITIFAVEPSQCESF